MSLLEVADLKVGFGRSLPLQRVDFVLEPGSRTALLGASGSGKSLTVLAIAGLLPQGARMQGRIVWKGLPGGMHLVRDVGIEGLQLLVGLLRAIEHGVELRHPRGDLGCIGRRIDAPARRRGAGGGGFTDQLLQRLEAAADQQRAGQRDRSGTQHDGAQQGPCKPGEDA